MTIRELSNEELTRALAATARVAGPNAPETLALRLEVERRLRRLPNKPRRERHKGAQR